jgi:hypothetical protein
MSEYKPTHTARFATGKVINFTAEDDGEAMTMAKMWAINNVQDEHNREVTMVVRLPATIIYMQGATDAETT